MEKIEKIEKIDQYIKSNFKIYKNLLITLFRLTNIRRNSQKNRWKSESKIKSNRKGRIRHHHHFLKYYKRFKIHIPKFISSIHHFH